MSTQKRPQTFRNKLNERGMVSIMVTMILMIVMSLIVLGFAQISRRNQRESLDRQLSTQAFYAAESGVNDARELITNAAQNNQAIPAKTSCTDTGNGFYSTLVNGNQLSNGVSYSCVLVNPSPKSLEYSDIGTTGTVIPLESTGANFSSIKVTWKSKTNSATPAANCPASVNNVFTSAANWTCGYGVMRLDIVPVSGSALNSGNLQDNALTLFAVPRQSNTPVTTAHGGGGRVINAACNNTQCEITINNLNTNAYYMKAISLYQNASLEVSGADGAGSAISLTGAQIIIDATGKAQDVLRRIQVHMPINGYGSRNQLPDNAIESTDSLCKRFSAMENYFDNSSTANGTNPLCQP